MGVDKMKRKQKHMKLLQRSLSWLLLLGTLLAAVAGNSLSVSAFTEITNPSDKYVTDGPDYIYRMSYTYTRPRTNFESVEGAATVESNFQLFLYGDIPVPAASGVYSLGYVNSSGICLKFPAYSADSFPALSTGKGFYFSSFRVASVRSSTGDVISEKVGPLPDCQLDSSIYNSLCSFTFTSSSVAAGTSFYTCTGYVFKSLEAAQAYFDSGDTTGLVQAPVIPPTVGDDDDGWLQDLIDKLKEWEDGAFGALVAPFIAFGEGLQSIKNAILNILPERIREVLSKVLDAQEGLARNTFGKVHDIYEFMKTKAAEFISFLTDIHSELVNISKGILKFSWDLLPDAIKEKLQPFLDGISGLLDKLKEGIDRLGEKFTNLIPSINDIKDAVKNSRVASYLSDMKEMFDSFPGLSAAIQTFLEDPLGFIIGSAVKGFQNSPIGLLLLPSEEFMSKFIANLREDFSGIFAIIDEVQKIINYMKTASGTKAPSFTINLGQSASYYLGESVTIDFSWYDAYKPTVDLLFAAIIWAGFLWRMYCRIPEIINGVGMTVTASYRIGRRGDHAD